MASSLASQPEDGKAFSRPLAGTHDATNSPAARAPILHQGNLCAAETGYDEVSSMVWNVSSGDRVTIWCARF
jgi:hypothetical protein